MCVRAGEGEGCGSVGDLSGACLASAPLLPSLWTLEPGLLGEGLRPGGFQTAKTSRKESSVWGKGSAPGWIPKLLLGRPDSEHPTSKGNWAKHKGKKRLDFIFLPTFYFYFQELFMSFPVTRSSLYHCPLLASSHCCSFIKDFWHQIHDLSHHLTSWRRHPGRFHLQELHPSTPSSHNSGTPTSRDHHLTSASVTDSWTIS